MPDTSRDFHVWTPSRLLDAKIEGLGEKMARGTYMGVNGKGGEYRLGHLFRSVTILVGNRYGPFEVPRCRSTTGDTEWTEPDSHDLGAIPTQLAANRVGIAPRSCEK